MTKPVRVAHFLNQFFAGIGGEEAADTPPGVRPGPVGPGRAIQEALGADGAVVCSLVAGDNWFAGQADAAVREAAAALAAHAPEVLIAGPAFASGRYGLACGKIAEAARALLGLETVGGMHPENPGVTLHRSNLFIVPTGQTAAGMASAVERMVRLAVKIARGEPLAGPEAEGYLARGIRRNTFPAMPPAERAIGLLLAKLRGQAYRSEIPLPTFTPVPAAAAVRDLANATLAVVMTGGVVPRGNPDRMESRQATKWGRYDLAGLESAGVDRFECVHGGFDHSLLNADPNRVLPLDALRELEREGAFGRLHPAFYSTVGNMASIEASLRYAGEIAGALRADRVEGVIFAAT
jgi:glycine reductase